MAFWRVGTRRRRVCQEGGVVSWRWVNGGRWLEGEEWTMGMGEEGKGEVPFSGHGSRLDRSPCRRSCRGSTRACR